MKVGVLGGGLTGLTVSYFLAKKGHQVIIWEKESVLGGMASGYKTRDWDWYLDKTYHHLFANDHDIFDFAQEIGFNKIFFQKPETASLYKNPKSAYSPIWKVYQQTRSTSQSTQFLMCPLDTPLDFLKFPLLKPFDKIRSGSIIAFLKLSPFLPYYEKITSEDFLKKTMGEESWKILWQQLFRKKFGENAGNILASFFWARIKKRTKKLGYIRGGFQTFINHLEKVNHNLGVVIKKNYEVKNIEKDKNGFKIGEESCNIVVSTLPTPVLINIGKNIFPKNYLSRLKKIKYLHSLDLIIESPLPLFDKTYWLNICDKNIPIMGLVQHTNFINKKHYNNKHILYIANYVSDDSKLLRMGDKQLSNFFLTYLKQINKRFRFTDCVSHVFKYAQPIFDKEFIKNRPDFKTPVDNFYIANLDMTYPYDRGTNYAVVLGKKVSELI